MRGVAWRFAPLGPSRGASPGDLLRSGRPLQAAAAAWRAVVLPSLYAVPGALPMSVRWW
jgi:hypothetical protein